MFKKRVVQIFIFAFIFAFIFQGLKWKNSNIIDGSMWINQARYVQDGDGRQFDFKNAYGHPGGTIIEPEIIFNKFFDGAHKHSEGFLIFLLTFLNSLFIAGICALCYLLRKNNFWWFIVLIFLSFDTLYDYATPTTAVVVPLVVFLSLLTLYFVENKEKIKTKHLLFWSLIAGLSVATRFDIGGFCVFSFLVLLSVMKIINWKKILIITSGAVASFILFDPFMWYMPIQHIKDLFFKIFFHYAEYALTPISFLRVYDISIFAFIGVFLAIIILFSKKKIKTLVSLDFMITILCMIFCLYFVFLTAHYKAERYFQPIISIWEVFLPLFIFPFLPKIFLSFTENKKEKIVIFSLIILRLIIFLLHYKFIILPH